MCAMPRDPVLPAALTSCSPVMAVLLSLISVRSLRGEAADSGRRPDAGPAALRSAHVPDAIPRRFWRPSCEPPGRGEATPPRRRLPPIARQPAASHWAHARCQLVLRGHGLLRAGRRLDRAAPDRKAGAASRAVGAAGSAVAALGLPV